MPFARHLLALDQGTTSSRAIVFGAGGAPVASAQREIACSYPKPGWVEQDPAAIWASQRATAEEALAQAGLTGRDLVAVGITNQRETTLLWERASGRPVYPAISWQDRRTAGECARLRRAGAEREIAERTGLRLDPYFSATKIRWILDQAPGLRARAEKGELCFGTVDSWLVWQLTGGRRHITDASNASRTLLYSLRTGKWDERLLQLFAVPRAILPEIRSSAEVYGEIDPDLPGGGAPIAGIAGDQQAALFGQACFQPGMAKNTYGTGCFLLLNTGTTAIVSHQHLLTTVAWRIGDSTTFALEGSVFTAGAAIQWLRDELGLVRSAQELDELAATVPDTGGAYLVPAFTGLGAPHWDPYARGTLVGMTRGTNRAHLCRAVLEAIAFQSADLVVAMERDSRLQLDELRVDGGASRSRLLMQFQADLLGIPVVKPQHVETTALGAAYLAGLAVGYWGSLDEIARNRETGEHFTPAGRRMDMSERRHQWERALERARNWGNSGVGTMDRSAALDRLRSGSDHFDFLIIGGGATGLGAAVDAAARGHRVALIEQSDFAKGTSSRSTKLVHGGVRYLRQGNISLVLEALRERGRLTRNAPHLVRDLAFVIPNYSWWEGPFYGVGMKVYDQLAGRLGLAPSRVLSREETVALIPTVETDHLVGGVVYHDGQFDDSRLAINLAQTAGELGATLANYCACVGLVKEGGAVAGALVRDGETGAEFTLRARAVINATGVFVDSVREWDEPGARPLVTASQGIHLVLPQEFLPGAAAIMIPKTDDGRVLFAVPWHDRVIVGTTDTPRTGPTLEPRALPAEREFLMKHMRRYLTKAPKDADVLSIFAGLRPLVRSGDGGPTAALSRDHTIVVAESGLITITGGKWTTYRKMAEDVIDHAEMVAGVENRRSPTETLPIHGSTLDPIPKKNLQPYGGDATRIAALSAANPTLAESLHPRLPYQRAELVWHARQEMARTVEDVLARRTRALLLDARASVEAAPLAAQILAKELGRDDAWQAAQVAAYAATARGYIYSDPASMSRGDK